MPTPFSRSVCKSVRELLGLVATVAIFAGASNPTAHAQASLVFNLPASADTPSNAAQSVGVSPVVFQNKILYVYQSTSPTGGEVCYGTVGFSGIVCPDRQYPGFPLVDSVPQATVWNGVLYLAFAAHSSHQLVIAKSPDGVSWTWTQPAGLFVGVSPAIAVLNNTLFVSYQENASDHYLGIAKSTDGVNWTNQLSSVYKIGHAPGMTYFNGQLVIAAFCQCSSHYLDVYTTTGSLTPSFAVEDTTKTLANASQPSLAVSNNVLLLGYMQNGQRYFQTATSYDAIHWTSAYRQTSLTNGWNGLGLAVVGTQIWGIYESQNAISGDPNSGPNEFAFSQGNNVN